MKIIITKPNIQLTRLSQSSISSKSQSIKMIHHFCSQQWSENTESWYLSISELTTPLCRWHSILFMTQTKGNKNKWTLFSAFALRRLWIKNITRTKTWGTPLTTGCFTSELQMRWNAPLPQQGWMFAIARGLSGSNKSKLNAGILDDYSESAQNSFILHRWKKHIYELWHQSNVTASDGTPGYALRKNGCKRTLLQGPGFHQASRLWKNWFPVRTCRTLMDWKKPVCVLSACLLLRVYPARRTSLVTTRTPNNVAKRSVHNIIQSHQTFLNCTWTHTTKKDTR